MSFKSASKRAGRSAAEAASWLVTEMHDGPRRERIEDIDEQIKELQEERIRLVDELIDKTDHQ